MFLMFQLDRPDVLAVGDLGIRRAVERAYGLDALPDAGGAHRAGRAVAAVPDDRVPDPVALARQHAGAAARRRARVAAAQRRRVGAAPRRRPGGPGAGAPGGAVAAPCEPLVVGRPGAGQADVGEADRERRVVAERVLERGLDARVDVPAAQRGVERAAVAAQRREAARPVAADVLAADAGLGDPDRLVLRARALVERGLELLDRQQRGLGPPALGVRVLRVHRRRADHVVRQPRVELLDPGAAQARPRQARRARRRRASARRAAARARRASRGRASCRPRATPAATSGRTPRAAG